MLQFCNYILDIKKFMILVSSSSPGALNTGRI